MRVLVTGAAGQLGSELVADLARRATGVVHGPPWLIVGLPRAELDVSFRDSVFTAVAGAEPDVIIHPAAWTNVDECEGDADRAFRVNALGTRNVAGAARLVGAHLCYISTDYVFDGRSSRPYNEWDEPNPTSVYGRSKLAGEREAGHEATIVRTAWVCGRNGANMAKTVLGLASRVGTLSFVNDQHGSPTLASDLATKIVDLALARRSGIFHVTNQGSTTWYGFAREVLRLSGHDPERVRPILTKDLYPPRAALRPKWSVLDNAALRLGREELLPPWQDALARLVAELIDG